MIDFDQLTVHLQGSEGRVAVQICPISFATACKPPPRSSCRRGHGHAVGKRPYNAVQQPVRSTTDSVGGNRVFNAIAASLPPRCTLHTHAGPNQTRSMHEHVRTALTAAVTAAALSLSVTTAAHAAVRLPPIDKGMSLRHTSLFCSPHHPAHRPKSLRARLRRQHHRPSQRRQRQGARPSTVQACQG